MKLTAHVHLVSTVIVFEVTHLFHLHDCTTWTGHNCRQVPDTFCLVNLQSVSRSAEVFQNCRSHLKIPDAWKMMQSKLPSENPQILRAIVVQSLVVKNKSTKEAKISSKPNISTYHNETEVYYHEPKQIKK